jgi:hypothetical protein
MIYRPRSLGDVATDNPYVFVSEDPAPSCYPTSFVGPIPPGSAYCGGGLPAGLSVPTSPSTIFAGVPDRAVYTAAAVLLGVVLLGALHK